MTAVRTRAVLELFVPAFLSIVFANFSLSLFATAAAGGNFYAPTAANGKLSPPQLRRRKLSPPRLLPTELFLHCNSAAGNFLRCGPCETLSAAARPPENFLRPGFAARCAARLRRAVGPKLYLGSAPRPAFGLGRSKPEPGAEPLVFNKPPGEAEPRRTSGGKAGAEVPAILTSFNAPELRRQSRERDPELKPF